MKKLLILLLLLPSLAWGQEYARMNPYILGGGASAAAACQATAWIDTFGASAGSINIGQSTTLYYGGNRDWDFGANKTICKVEFKLTCPYSDCAGNNYYVAFYTMNGTALGTLVNAASEATAGSNSWSTSTVVFNFNSNNYPQVSNGTAYALVLYTDTPGDDHAHAETIVSNGYYSGVWDSSKVRQDSFSDTQAQVKIYTYE